MATGNNFVLSIKTFFEMLRLKKSTKCYLVRIRAVVSSLINVKVVETIQMSISDATVVFAQIVVKTILKNGLKVSKVHYLIFLIVMLFSQFQIYCGVSLERIVFY